MSSNAIEGLSGYATSGTREQRRSIWSQLRRWTQRMSRKERCAVAATMTTTFILIGVMLVALHLTLQDYVIDLRAWPI